MKLVSVTLTNVKSFLDRTSLRLEPGLNVLVGPNGGGKSNLLDAITVVMRRTVLPGFRTENRGSGEMQINRVRHFQRITDILPKYSGNESNPQTLELEIVFEEADLQNIKALVENIDLLDRMLDQFRNAKEFSLQFIREWDLPEFEAGTRIMVRIHEGQEQWTGDDQQITDNWRKYLTNFELLSLLLHEARGPRLHPAFLYFSPFRGSAQTGHFQANLSGTAFLDVLSSYFGSTSQSQTSLIQAASLYFAEKHRMLEAAALDQGFLQQWEEDPEVRLVTKHLGRLGYGWTLRMVDARKNLYQMELTKHDVQFDIAQSSSGEKEIVNYILGIFALHLRDGLLAIDEAELHLHPRWQVLLLDILFDLVDATGNQIILSTHSPMFVTPRSVAHVIRVFRDDTQVSRLLRIDSPEQQEARDTVHIVNAHNNAKMFFADRVILVEGIQDRLIFERIAELFRTVRESTDVVEVLEVHGKGNFQRYQSFLDRLSVPDSVIADFDYLFQIGQGDVRALFVTDDRRVNSNVLKNKKSQDRVNLAKVMRQALQKRDLEQLEGIWQYIESRHLRLKKCLSRNEKRCLEAALVDARKHGVYLLRKGEIEDYLPDGARDVAGTVELTRSTSFENWLLSKWSDGTEELVRAIAEIIGASEEEVMAVKRLAQQRLT